MNRFTRITLVATMTLLLSVSFGIAGTSPAKKESKAIPSKAKTESVNKSQSNKLATAEKSQSGEQNGKTGSAQVKSKDDTLTDSRLNAEEANDGIVQKVFSTGEQIDWQVLSDGGGLSTTTGLQLFSVIGQTADGESVSGSLRLQQGFLQNFLGPQACCVGVTGNIDCDPNSVVDIADLTTLIDHLFIDLQPLCCKAEGNIDGDPTGEVGLADLTTLIDHLFISLKPTAACQ